jgi:4-hydroxythreonine-4-phosphate dehydrogenase
MAARIAISMGDPTGIGPEITLKALADNTFDASFQVYGATSVYRQIAERIDLAWPLEGVEWFEATGEADLGSLRLGAPGIEAGRAQIACLVAAVDAVCAGRADALCTAPITKAAAHEAGFAYPGHTEYLAWRFEAQHHAMMLAGPGLRVVPLTGHVPLSDVPAALSPELVAERAVLTVQSLARDFGVSEPRVALAALNPHAGEQGMLGPEEEWVLTPGLERAGQDLARMGVKAVLEGPVPADALFVPPVAYDAVLCCYHDQAMIPIKMHCRDEAVNVTLGLGAIRTSPAHGSAPDIAGQGVARADSMVAALQLAIALAARE